MAQLVSILQPALAINPRYLSQKPLNIEMKTNFNSGGNKHKVALSSGQLLFEIRSIQGSSIQAKSIHDPETGAAVLYLRSSKTARGDNCHIATLEENGPPVLRVESREGTTSSKIYFTNHVDRRLDSTATSVTAVSDDLENLMEFAPIKGGKSGTFTIQGQVVATFEGPSSWSFSAKSRVMIAPGLDPSIVIAALVGSLDIAHASFTMAGTPGTTSAPGNVLISEVGGGY